MSIYIYLYIYWRRTERSRVLAKELNVLTFLQIAFFVFFSILCKRTLCSLRSFPFFRKEQKSTERSFGSHKSPKTSFLRTEKNGTYRTEKNVVPNPDAMWSELQVLGKYSCFRENFVIQPVYIRVYFNFIIHPGTI